MNKKTILTLLLSAFVSVASAQQPASVQQVGEHHAIERVATTSKYLLLPVEESAENAHIRVIRGGKLLQEFNCRLAVNKTDYYVPLDLSAFGSGDVMLDITFP